LLETVKIDVDLGEPLRKVHFYRVSFVRRRVGVGESPNHSLEIGRLTGHCDGAVLEARSQKKLLHELEHSSDLRLYRLDRRLPLLGIEHEIVAAQHGSVAGDERQRAAQFVRNH